MHQLILQIPDSMALLTQLGTKGPVFTLLVLIILFFYKRQSKLEADIKAATDKLEEYIVADRERILTALNNSTEAIQDLKELYNRVK